MSGTCIWTCFDTGYPMWVFSEGTVEVTWRRVISVDPEPESAPQWTILRGGPPLSAAQSFGEFGPTGIP